MVALRYIMSEDVFVAAPETPIAEVAEELVRRRIGSATVSVGGTLVGIFTERDVLRAAASRSDLGTATVRDWMTEDPVTASPDQDSEDAVETMLAGGFRHLPVVDGAKLVGIVSLRDLLGARIRRT